METIEMFNILDSVDSTNNYAMAMIHAGMAKHGMAWFAHEQTVGRGQQGKIWESSAGQNIALSIVVQPQEVFFQNQFYFNAAIANACYDFYRSYAGEAVSIKWPNDIYWRDRKAGGILIENKLMGKTWKWSVIGIGININQTIFSDPLFHAVSLKQITGKQHEPVALAKELYEYVLRAVNETTVRDFPGILLRYNERLFQKGRITRLKKDNLVFETLIKGVNEYGQLITADTIQRLFNFGEVEWVKEV